MSYPYLPVSSCCTDVVLNSPCGCSSTITNSGCGSNDPCGTNVILSSNVIYNGPNLPCIIAEPCDTLNVVLQKIDQIICNLLSQINILNIQVTNINSELITINSDITNIYNTLSYCCVTTTTTSTTIHPCEQFSLNNTGVDPVAIIITDCITQMEEAIVLLPGDTNICVVTDSPLTVPGTVIITPNGPCGTSTTTSTSSSTTTSTTTVLYPCECLTFNNRDVDTHIITYIDCNNDPSGPVEIFSNEVIKICGSQGFASDPLVLITVGQDCRTGERCIVLPTTTTTTSSTSTTTSTSSSTTSTTTTSVPPPIRNLSSEYQATVELGCSALDYPFSYPLPSPQVVTGMFIPTISWSDIEYVEIVSVTPVAGLQIKYNGIIVAPSLKIYPTGLYTWQHPMLMTRSSFQCNTLFEYWQIKVKLYGYTELTNVATLGTGFVQNYCPDCTSTTTTSSSSTSTSSTSTSSTSSTSTTTTSTTCNPSIAHPFTVTVVNGTNTIPDSGSFLVDACDAAACLQANTCTTASSTTAHWNQQYPELGDVAYLAGSGCTLRGLNGYYQINYDGIWVVVEIVNSVIVDFPSCITTTTTTTTIVVDCIDYFVQGNAPSGSWTGFDCNGAPISGTVTGGGTQSTGCMNAATLVLNNAYIKGSTPCTTTTTTTAL